MELRGFKENIECVEKHLEFIYENLHEISEKVYTEIPEYSKDIFKLRKYILSYYKEIQKAKLIVNLLEEGKSDENLLSHIIELLLKIRKNLRTIRKILHKIKNDYLDKIYDKISKEDISKLKDYNFNESEASFLEEIMDCRGNLYAAERHLTEFISALIKKFERKENEG